MADRRRMVERDVRVDDPELSTEANERLTDELQDAVGADHVSVPERRSESLARAPLGPSRTLGAPPALPILAVAGSLALGIVAAEMFGGVAWIGALLLLGAAVAWSLLEVEIAHDERGPERAFGDDFAGHRRRLIPTVVAVVAAVVAGVIVVGALAGYL